MRTRAEGERIDAIRTGEVLVNQSLYPVDTLANETSHSWVHESEIAASKRMPERQ